MKRETTQPGAKADCPDCGAPQRVLWTYGQHPGFRSVEVGNWNSLVRCGACGCLWVEVPHEPHSGFSFWTLWPSTREVWRRLNAREAALIIHEWHNAVICEAWEALPESERRHVAWWRRRSYGYFNAIDRTDQEARFVSKASDLLRHLEE